MATRWSAMGVVMLCLMAGSCPVAAFDVSPLYGDAIQLYSNAAPYNLNSETYTFSEVWRTKAQPDITFLPNTYNTPLVTRGTNTFLVFVDPDHRLRIAKISGGTVQQAFIDNNLYQPDEFYANHDSDPSNDVTAPDYYRVKFQDSHHAPALGIDENGYLHIAADMHNYPRYEPPQVHLPLRYAYKKMMYWRSDNPLDISSFSFLGDQSTKCPQGTGFTYVTFFNDLNGTLFYASRGMQKSDLRCAVFSRYDAGSGNWSIIGGTVPGEPDHPRTFFTDGREYDASSPNSKYSKTHPTGVFDRQNHLHLVAPLLSDPTLNPWGADSAQHFVDEILYARSVDDGVTFTKANGTLVLMPATDDPGVNQADILYKTNGYLSVMGVVAVDYQNNPYAVVQHKYPDGSPDQSQIIGWNGSTWINYGEITTSSADFRLVHDPAGVMSFIPDSNARFYRFWKPDGTIRTVNLPAGWYVRGVDYEYLKKTGNIMGFRKDGSNELVVVKVEIHNRPGMTLVTPPSEVITNSPPVITQVASADGNDLSVRALDPDGDPLTYTWHVQYGQGTATFMPNGTAASSNTVASYTAMGTYELKVAVSDGVNTTISTCPVTVLTNSYTLTYTAGPNGSISGTSPQTVNHGADGTAVTAVPDTGYHFVNWSDSSTANPRTDFNVTGDITVTANFASNIAQVVSYQIGGLLEERNTGWNSLIANGSTGTFSFADATDPNLGFTVTAVAGNGDALDLNTTHLGVDSTVRNGTDANTSRINGDEFITLSVSYADPNGRLQSLELEKLGPYWGNGATETTVFTDANAHSTNIVAFNHTLTNNLIDYATTGLDPLTKSNTGSWTLKVAVSDALGTTASGMGAFRLRYAVGLPSVYTLTYQAGPHGTISGTSTQTVHHGGSGTAVTAVPDSGYSFVNWSDASTENPRTDLTVTNDISVTASFTQLEPPAIASGPALSGGDFKFQFIGTVGQHYRVEYTPVLPAPGSWQVVTDIVSLATSPCPISVPATNGIGFYRVGWVP